MNTKVVTFGELLLRLASPLHQRFSQAQVFEKSFGGSEANVAISLARLGIASEFVTQLPRNDFGQSALMLLKMHDVENDHIIIGGNRMGLYFVEKGSMNRPSRVIYDRQYSSFSEIQPGSINWDQVLEQGSWFHWSGITPAVSQSAANVCKDALMVAAKKGITISCDLNYRDALWNYGVNTTTMMAEMVKECDVIISNEEDSEKFFNIKPEKNNVIDGEIDYKSYEQVGRKLCERFPKVKIVAFSLRSSRSADDNSWSGVIWDGKSLIKSKEYQMTNIVDRIGGGDSFAAGLIYGLINHPADRQRTIDFAVAASSLKHTIHGDFNLSTLGEVLAVMDGNFAGRIQR
ncbi:MAG: sugar kinase [Bacteroidota bacterium]